jgi:hypothetical protein
MVLKAILDGNYAEAEMVDPKVGRGFSRILDKCLARDPDARYATVEELSSRLRDFLHESEVTDPEGWWLAFYHEPAPTSRRLRAHVLAALERRGREALKARRTAAALAHFNRVLAIEPEHEAVLRLIRRLDQRRKVYFYAGALAALGLTVAVAFAVSAALERADEAALQPVIVPPVPSDPRFDAGIAGTAVGKDLGTSARRVVRVLEPRVRFVEARDVVRFQLWEAVLHAQDLLRDPTVDPPLPTEERNPVAVVAPEPRPDPNKTPDGRAKPPLTEDADAKPSGDPGLPTPTPPALVAVRLSVFPPRGTKLSVEGRVYSDAELGAGLRLPPGLLRYELTHEHYKPQRGVLNTNAAKDGAMSVRLAMADLKPAVLQVACDDPGASVLVFDESNHQILGGKVRMPLSIPVLDQISAQRRIWFQVIPSVDRPPGPRQGLSVTAGSQYTPAINVLR